MGTLRQRAHMLVLACYRRAASTMAASSSPAPLFQALAEVAGASYSSAFLLPPSPSPSPSQPGGLARVLDEYEVQRARRACGDGDTARAVAFARKAAEGAQAATQGS